MKNNSAAKDIFIGYMNELLNEEQNSEEISSDNSVNSAYPIVADGGGVDAMRCEQTQEGDEPKDVFRRWLMSV